MLLPDRQGLSSPPCSARRSTTTRAGLTGIAFERPRRIVRFSDHAVSVERDVTATMHILWVKMGGLWPATSGGRVRSLQIVSALARRHRVTVLTTHGAGDDPDGLARQLSHCQRVVSMPLAVGQAWRCRIRRRGGAVVAVALPR